MTVEQDQSWYSDQGNGITTDFLFNNTLLPENELQVDLVDRTSGVATPQVEGVDYTLTRAADFKSATVSFAGLAGAPSSAYDVRRYRNDVYTQPATYEEGDDFPAKVHEHALDRVTILTQQSRDDRNRTLRAPRSDVEVNEMPNSIARANTILGFDNDGQPIAAEPASFDLTPIAARSVIANDTAGIQLPTAVATDDLTVLATNQSERRTLAEHTSGKVYDFDNAAAMVNASYLALGDSARTKGYALANDEGGEIYRIVAGGTGVNDNGRYFNLANGLQAELQVYDRLNLVSFGGTGDGSTDNASAITSWISAILATGRPGYVPAGVYNHSGRLLIDLQLSATKTVKIYGEGAYSSTFNMTGATTPLVNIYRTVTGGFDHFYGVFNDIGFQADTTGTAFALGLSDFSDAVGNYNFTNCYFGNSNSGLGASAVTLQGNFLFDSQFNNCVIVGRVGYGTSLQARKMQFTSFFGGSISNASKAIQFVDDTSIAMNFYNLDIENCDYCVSQESAATLKILFSGGFWDLYRPDLASVGTACVNTPVGGRGSVIIDNVHSTRIGAELYGGVFLAANAKDFNGRVGVRGNYGGTTPSLPASTVTIANDTGQNQSVTIHGGTVTDIYIRTVSTGFTGGQFTLAPGDYISVIYSAAPTWEWAPIWA